MPFISSALHLKGMLLQRSKQKQKAERLANAELMVPTKMPHNLVQYMKRDFEIKFAKTKNFDEPGI